MDNQKAWLTRKELAYHLRISLSSVDRGIRSNRWPFNNRVKVGGKVLFPISILSEIEAKAKSDAAITREEQYDRPA
ncbi:MAG: hypothetical protein LBE17_04135 [Treponema sp.]|jgi:hypothetical protein|nr:hypothetical protein [Treponema sp.]